MKRVPRLLLVAFALSLLLHFIVAIVLRPPAPSSTTQAEVVSIQHRPATIALRKPPTPPPSKPTPAPRASASAAPVRKGPGKPVAPVGNAATPAPPAATPTRQPAPAATIACAHADVGAAVTATAPPPDIPTQARASGTSGTALVGVQLDPMGQVTGAAVTQSTGNSSLDLVAVAMARDARYSPALRDCKPVAGSYSFSVKFVAW